MCRGHNDSTVHLGNSDCIRDQEAPDRTESVWNRCPGHSLEGKETQSLSQNLGLIGVLSVLKDEDSGSWAPWGLITETPKS